jgi:hypothetical protein
MAKIQSYKHLQVYKIAMQAAMRIFELTKQFPHEEHYSLVDHIYDNIIAKLVCMIKEPENWIIS